MGKNIFTFPFWGYMFLYCHHLTPCVSGWEKFTDVGISEWTCGNCEHAITTWSHSRPAEIGMLIHVATPQISLPSILCLCVLLPLCVLSGWGKFTDIGISEWTCGGGGQVITTWSHSRPAECGTL